MSFQVRSLAPCIFLDMTWQYWTSWEVVTMVWQTTKRCGRPSAWVRSRPGRTSTPGWPGRSRRWGQWSPGPWFNIKMSSYQYRKSHCGDKTVVSSSYLHNGISYTGKMSSLYGIGPLFPNVFRALFKIDENIFCSFAPKYRTTTFFCTFHDSCVVVSLRAKILKHWV